MRKYLEREYGSQRIYQGGLRVHTTLDPSMQRAAVRALKDGLRTLDRRARGFVRPETSLLSEDGLLPEPLHLDEWDWPFAAGDVVRGVVVASDRFTAVVQVGDYRARLSPADVAWTRRTSLADVLPRGVVAPFRIVSSTPSGKEARVQLEQEPKVEGALLAMDVRSGGGAGDGRRLRLREEQVQPRDAGDAAGGLGLQADRLRRRPRDARLDALHDPRGLAASASPTPGTARSGRRRTTTAPTWARSRCAGRSSRAATSRR